VTRRRGQQKRSLIGTPAKESGVRKGPETVSEKEKLGTRVKKKKSLKYQKENVGWGGNTGRMPPRTRQKDWGDLGGQEKILLKAKNYCNPGLVEPKQGGHLTRTRGDKGGTKKG